jgi:hypothetical protein
MISLVQKKESLPQTKKTKKNPNLGKRHTLNNFTFPTNSFYAKQIQTFQTLLIFRDASNN